MASDQHGGGDHAIAQPPQFETRREIQVALEPIAGAFREPNRAFARDQRVREPAAAHLVQGARFAAGQRALGPRREEVVAHDEAPARHQLACGGGEVRGRVGAVDERFDREGELGRADAGGQLEEVRFQAAHAFAEATRGDALGRPSGLHPAQGHAGAADGGTFGQVQQRGADAAPEVEHVQRLGKARLQWLHLGEDQVVQVAQRSGSGGHPLAAHRPVDRPGRAAMPETLETNRIFVVITPHFVDGRAGALPHCGARTMPGPWQHGHRLP
jgi:hypothetical protein